MTVRIVTDSACDLSDVELEEWGIGMVPLSIRFGDEEFVDRTELSTDEFYRRLGESQHLPETSAPAPGAFAAMFNKMAAEGASAVVCINLSEALSATIQSARTAAGSDDVQIDVRVINSKSVTGGLGSIVLACAKAGRDAVRYSKRGERTHEHHRRRDRHPRRTWHHRNHLPNSGLERSRCPSTRCEH